MGTQFFKLLVLSQLHSLNFEPTTQGQRPNCDVYQNTMRYLLKCRFQDPTSGDADSESLNGVPRILYLNIFKHPA